jgi:hypothetical protein
MMIWRIFTVLPQFEGSTQESRDMIGIGYGGVMEGRKGKPQGYNKIDFQIKTK